MSSAVAEQRSRHREEEVMLILRLHLDPVPARGVSPWVRHWCARERISYCYITVNVKHYCRHRTTALWLSPFPHLPRQCFCPFSRLSGTCHAHYVTIDTFARVSQFWRSWLRWFRERDIREIRGFCKGIYTTRSWVSIFEQHLASQRLWIHPAVKFWLFLVSY